MLLVRGDAIRGCGLDLGRAEEALFAQLEVRGDDARLDEVRAQLEELLRELQAESRGPAAESARGKRLVLGWYPLPE